MYITNKYPHKKITSLQLSFQNLYGLVWGLSKPNANNLYLFPKWMKSLSPSQSLDFAYIRFGPLVIISVFYYLMPLVIISVVYYQMN